MVTWLANTIDKGYQKQANTIIGYQTLSFIFYQYCIRKLKLGPKKCLLDSVCLQKKWWGAIFAKIVFGHF